MNKGIDCDISESCCVNMVDWFYLRRVNLVFFLFLEDDELDGMDGENGCYFIFCKY